ncbi:MAG: dethiobiotin synthase [Steroidobacteraceae bacterium]|nr:dethiobiotin synthase [Steroidobacteraceae bacterium]
MTRAYFVTGTDTGVGKTLVTAALLRRLREAGVAVAGMKPIAAGAMDGPEGRANEDALLLQAESSVRHPYPLVNPCLYEPAIAPHIAAAESGVAIDLERIEAAFRALASTADVVLAEGAGGFLVPLDDARSCAELPLRLGMDVILVVGLRLGCLNHALLTAEAIAARGLVLAGWVGNCVAPEFPRREANVATLEARLPAPCLGIVPWLQAADLARAAAALPGALSLRPR